MTKNTGQLETMLKVVLAPDEVPEGELHLLVMDEEGQADEAGFVQNYCLLIGDRAFTNFQKVHPICCCQVL